MLRTCPKAFHKLISLLRKVARAVKNYWKSYLDDFYSNSFAPIHGCHSLYYMPPANALCVHCTLCSQRSEIAIRLNSFSLWVSFCSCFEWVQIFSLYFSNYFIGGTSFFCPPQSYLIKTKWKNEANAIRTMYTRHRWFIFQFQYTE